jgi:TonB family protein
MNRTLGKFLIAGVALAALLLLGMPNYGGAQPQAAAEKPVKVAGDIKPPTLIKKVAPVYPEEARKQGIEGLVILEATVDVNGKVKDVKVLRPVPALNQAAIDAVKQWVYEPTVINGKPVPVVFTVTVNFKLKDKAAKAGVEGGVAGGVAGGVEGGIKGGVEGAVAGGVAGGVEGAVKAEGDIRPPTLVKMVEPVYPEEARKQGIEGLVILEATVDVNGKVKDVKVLRPVPALNQAAIDAVKQWVYEPKIIDGKPVPIVFTVTVNFKLKDK